MLTGHGLLERLARGEAVLGDGAWGTMLMARGLPSGEPPERVNLEKPEWLTEIALLYLEAGAEIVTTNTFGASPLRLAAHGLGERTEEICYRAVDAIAAVTRGRALIAGSVGPTGRLLAPLGDLSKEEATAAFSRQVAALARAGVDLISVETMTDLEEAVLAVAAARSVAPHLPVVATMTFDETPRGPFTVMGVSAARAAEGLTTAGADVIGSNCGTGIEAMLLVARELRRHTVKPLAIRANAGMPSVTSYGLLYGETPDLVAAHVPALLAAGVRLLGGCCGTTPGHIAALRRVLGPGRPASC